MPRIAHLASLIDWRQPGGLLSAAGHVAILVVSLAAFSSAKPFSPAEEAVPVDMISEKEFNEMIKGEREAKKAPEPVRRVDRPAETKQDAPPGEAKREIAAEPTPLPPTRPEPARPEPVKVEPPKPEPVKVEPTPAPSPLPVPPTPPRVAIAPPPAPPVRAPELRTRPPAPPEKSEEEDEEPAEVVRQKPPPKVEPPKPEPPKPQPAAAPPAPKTDDLAKLLEEKKREEEKAAEAQKAEEARKAEAARLAKEKAEREKAAREAREKAAREKAAKEAAEAKKLQDSILARLNASKEPPATTGATGAQVQQQASLGTPNATGKKLSPSERSQLIGILTEQMSRCISYSGAAPKAYPRLNFTLGRDGALVSAVNLGNSSPETNFRPFSEAAIRAVRACQPYRIPARFLESYDDWKNIQLTLITDDLQ